MTAVRPPARFGAIKVKNKVVYFKEKSNLDEGWINGGFFVMKNAIFDYIRGDKTFLEKEPLELIGKKNQPMHLSTTVIGSVWTLLEIEKY